MRKTAFLPILAILAALGPAALAAQEAEPAIVLTIDDAIALALRQNPFHLASQEKIAQARAGVRQAVSGFLPTLNAQGSDTLDEKLFVLEFPSMIPGEPPTRMSIDFTKDYQMAFSFGLPLYAGGRLTAGYKQANYGLKASQESVRLSEQETVLEAKRAFYGYLLAKEFSAAAAGGPGPGREVHAERQEPPRGRHGLEVRPPPLGGPVRQSQAAGHPGPQQRRRGRAGPEDRLRHRARHPDRGQGRARRAAPRRRSPGHRRRGPGADRPELRQLDYQRRMAGEMLKVARGALLPTVALGGQYNVWSDALNLRKGTWSNYYTISLSLSIPLFNGFETQARIGQSKAAIRELDWTRKGLTNAIAFEVRQAALNLAQARETLLSLEKNVEQAREAVRIAELNYSEGLATNLDVSTAQVALSQARTNYSQALYDCVISQAQLEKAVGRSRSESRSN